MEAVDLDEALAAAPFKSSTTPAPHSYIVEHWDERCFDLVQRVRTKIREDGYWRFWRGHKYHGPHRR